MKIVIKYLLSNSILLFLLFQTTGCSYKLGTVMPTSHYVFPNSNVTPLGRATNEIKKSSILIPPEIDANDIDRLYSGALNKHSGADILVDCSVDTKITTILFFHILKMNVSGTAAKMEVGRQDIGQDN